MENKKITPITDLTFVDAYVDKNAEKKSYGLKGINGIPGVYFIKEDDVIVYIGMSRVNVQKALYRHFQHWKSWRQRRVSYKNTLLNHKYEVACITMEYFMAHETEKAYILMYNPRDNFDRYEEYSRQVNIEIKEPEMNTEGIYDFIYTDLPF